MDQRTRMFKTLGCLAGAMVGASALLGWMDPSPSLGSAPPSFEAMLHEARALVSDWGGDGDTRWHRVEIVAGPIVGDSPAFLAATADDTGCHVRIGLDGRPISTKPGAREAGGSPGVLRIEVLRGAAGEPMSVAQCAGIRALVTALAEYTGSGMLPIRLTDEWARVYDLDAQAEVTFSANGHTSD